MAKYTKRKDGRYSTTVYTGEIDQATGKKQKAYVYGKSIAELERNKAEVIDQINKGTYVANRHTFFRDYKWEWLRLYKAGCAKSTIDGYANILKNHTGALDGLKLLDIKKSDVQSGYNALSGHGDLQRRYAQTVSQVLRAAVGDGLLYKNVADSIEKVPSRRAKKRALSEEERSRIPGLDLDPKASCLLNILLYTGMRRQEIIPLTRFDINFNTRKISVNKAVTFDGNKAVLKETKTASGEREVYLLDPLAKALREYLPTLDGPLLFPGKDGGYMSRTQYRALFGRIRRSLNTACGGSYHYQNGRVVYDDDRCQGLGSHTFRHEFATMLYYSGIDIMEAVNIMGHSNSQMLLDTYAELRKKEGASIAKLNDFVGKSGLA